MIKFIVTMAFIFLFLSFSVEASFKEFINKRCIDCHDNDMKEGGISFEGLKYNQFDQATAKIWEKALKQIESGFMPPKKKEQPTPDERNSVTLDLENKLVNYYLGKDSHKTVLRRLNKTEYKKTIEDLLKLNLTLYDPTTEFPDDALSHGFDSNGEKLVTSSFLLKKYLNAADELVSRAVHFEKKPEMQAWDIKPPFDRTTMFQHHGEISYHKKNKIPYEYQTLYERIRGIPKMGYHPVDDLREGVPQNGYYKVKILAEAKFRYANMDPKKFRFASQWDASEPLRLSLISGTVANIDPSNKAARNLKAKSEQGGEVTYATWDLPDDKKVWLECKVWLDKGYFPRLGFPNGPSNSNYRLLNFFKDNKKELLSPEELAKFEAVDSKSKGSNVYMWFKSPRIRIYNIKVEGPINPDWPPESHKAIFGDTSFNAAKLRETIFNFASKAWRRPATESEVEPLIKLIQGHINSGLKPKEAVKEGLKAILVSPQFIYREEKSKELDSHELASRLSYFLWASMPDKELMLQAENTSLLKSEVLVKQALRMMNEPRIDSFVESFLNGWLRMRKLGSMAPDPNKFSSYYRDDLQTAMKIETSLFFKYMLQNNLPLNHFLDSDFTFVNPKLAKHYKLNYSDDLLAESVEGLSKSDLRNEGLGNSPSTAFFKIPLKENGMRGGLLGQASLLTLTANGVDTSPVIRGMWLLESILGTPPPPPPPNIPAIEPDIRGAKTIRDQLEKHRSSKACRSCHAVIDPPGFALENFDAVGRWRGHYIIGKKAIKIDSSGQFGKTNFKDLVEFKKELSKNIDLFTINFVKNILQHAMGREIRITDRPYLRAILKKAKENNYRLKDVILSCIESDIFKMK